HLTALRKQAMQAASLGEQLARVRQQRDRLAAEIADEPAKVRQQHAGCRAEEVAVTAQLQAERDELRCNQDELDRLAKDRERFVGQIAQFDGELRTEEAKRTHWRQALETSKAALPPTWAGDAERTKLSELYARVAERDELLARNTEQRANDLGHAPAEINALRQPRAAVDREGAAVPP